jgi:hypothetical protein
MKSLLKRADNEVSRKADLSSTPIILLALLVASRIMLPLIIKALPPMDTFYIRLGQQLFETQDKVDIKVSPFYASLIYGLNVFNSWHVTSWLLYTSFSIILGIVVYQLAKEMFDAQTARFALALSILHPSLTFAVAGYSHTVVVSTTFLYVSLYAYWKILQQQREVVMALVGSVSATLATLVRPELLLYFALFCCAMLITSISSVAKHKRYKPLAVTIGMLIIYASLIVLQHGVIRQRTNSAHMNLFTDARYSYETYTHTLSLRAVGVIDEDVARKLAREAFGDPEVNQYSITTAMRNNPKEAAKNIIFNLKELLDIAGHPLFMPFFLYILIGVGLAHSHTRQQWRQHLFLSALFLPCLAAVTIMHVEVRYLNPLVPPLIIWMALGMVHLQRSNKRGLQYIFFVLLSALFLANSVFYSLDPIMN